MAFDRLIFRLSHLRRPPVMMHAVHYRAMLEKAGLQVDETVLRSRLPLVHRIFMARRAR